jgi:lipopolysaccharide export system permease protein
MKIIYRYIYRELFFYIILSIIAINTLVMVEKLIRVAKTLSGMAGPLEFAKVIILIQPQMLLITIPVAFLISILLVYGRINMDNELIALMSAGASFKEVSLPAVRTGVLLLIVSLLVSTIIAPYGNRRLRDEINHILKTNITKKIEERTFTELGNIVIYTNSREENLLNDVFVFDRKRNSVITAKRASIMSEGSGIVMEFNDGLINMVEKERRTDIYFSSYRFQTGLDIQGISRKAGEFMPQELLKKAKEVEDKKALQYIMEFYRRFTYPFLNIVMALIGPGLSVLSGKTGRLGGLVAGIIFFVAYYLMAMYSEGLVEAGKVPVGAGMTAPIITGLVAGFILQRWKR